MKITKFLLGIPMLALLVQISSATTGMIGSTGQTMGPLGLLITLGFEYFPTLSTATAIFIYRWIAFIAIFLFALLTDARSATKLAVFAVIVSAFCAYVGWFTIPLPSGGVNPAGPWSLIIFMAIVTVLSYITEQNKINYGVAQGDPVLKIFLFIVIFNTFLGIMSSSYIFAGIPGIPNSPPICNSNSYANCAFNQQTGMSQLQSITAGQASSGGNGLFGVLAPAMDLALSLPQIALSAIFLVASIVTAIVFTFVPILATFPFLLQSPPALAFIGLCQLFIYWIYYLWITRIWGKVMPGELRV